MLYQGTGSILVVIRRSSTGNHIHTDSIARKRSDVGIRSVKFM